MLKIVMTVWHWWDDQMVWWLDDVMTRWPDDQMTKWLDDWMTDWPDDQITGSFADDWPYGIFVTIHGPRSAASPLLSGAVSTLLIIYTNVWRSTGMYCARMGTIVCCNYSWTIWTSIYIEIHEGRIGSDTNINECLVYTHVTKLHEWRVYLQRWFLGFKGMRSNYSSFRAAGPY